MRILYKYFVFLNESTEDRCLYFSHIAVVLKDVKQYIWDIHYANSMWVL